MTAQTETMTDLDDAVEVAEQAYAKLARRIARGDLSADFADLEAAERDVKLARIRRDFKPDVNREERDAANTARAEELRGMLPEVHDIKRRDALAVRLAGALAALLVESDRLQQARAEIVAELVSISSQTPLPDGLIIDTYSPHAMPIMDGDVEYQVPASPKTVVEQIIRAAWGETFPRSSPPGQR